MTLSLVRSDPDPLIVAACERLLTMAKSGELVAFVAGLQCADSTIATQIAIGGGGDIWRLLGAASALVHDLNVRGNER